MNNGEQFDVPIDDNGNTLLHKLATRGDEEAMKRLPQTVKIDVANDFGWTPLMMAARFGHLGCAKLFLDRRADSTRENVFGGSVFMCAITSGNLHMVKFMLEYLLRGGVSRNTIEATFSPISISILFDQEEIFQFLLDNQFKQDIINEPGLEPIVFAHLQQNKHFWKKLMAHDAPHRRTAEEKDEQNGKESQESIAYHIATEFGSYIEPPHVIQSTHQDFVFPMPVQMMPPPPPSAQHLPVATPSSYIVRTSSNVHTPTGLEPINISPITPLGCHYAYQQMFFPSDILYPHYHQPTCSPGFYHRFYMPHENHIIESPIIEDHDDDVFLV